MVGDEPQAAGTNNYFTNRAHNRGFFGEQPDQASGTAPAAAAAAAARANNEPRRASTTAAPEPTHGGDARNRSDESFFDSRQSTPYQTHGGEKFNPFDGVPAASDLNRTRSHRTVNPQAAAKPEFRRRSSSLPDESDNAAKATASARKRAAAGAGTTTAAAAAGAAAGFAAGMAAEAAAAANSPSTNSANTGVPRSGSRPRPGVSSRASRPATSSQMPQFEEQYQRMQGEQQQQQQQQQSNPFAASANAAQNDKSKPILYATSPLSQPPMQASPYMSSARDGPSRAVSDGTARAQRHMAYREPTMNTMNTVNTLNSSSPFGNHSPPAAEWPEPKRRVSPTYSKKESSSGDQMNKTSYNGGKNNFNNDYGRREKLRASLDEFDKKQFNMVQGLVNRVPTYRPRSTTTDSKSGSSQSGHAKSAGRTVPGEEAAMGLGMGRADDEQSTGFYGVPQARQRLRSGTVPSHNPPGQSHFHICGHQNHHYHHDRFHSHANAKSHYFSSNLSLDDDVFSVPSTPSDQERTNPFTRSSVEDINTRFVSGDKASAAWAFSAGGSEGEQQQNANGDFPSRVRRSQSGSRLGRRSPGKSNSIPKPDGGIAYPTPPRPPPPPPHPSQQQQQQAPQSQDPSPASSTIGVADGNSGKPNEANAAGAKNTDETTTNYFNAGRWAEQIGSEHFVPSWNAQQPPNLPPRQPTPTQQRARPIKKPKPIQRSNTAAPREYIVIDDDSDEEEGGGGPTAEAGTKRHHQPQPQQQQQQQPIEVEPDVSGFASPVAMDIDSPPAVEPVSFNGVGTADAARPVGSSGTDTAGGAPLSSPDPQVNGARNIPVEPTRPEWRAGDVNKAATTSAAAAAGAAGASAAASSAPKTAASNINVNNNVGSEDSEEFRATLSDIHKVEPFAENTSGIQGNAGTGLGSLGDLQNNLPFESKAASASMSMQQAAGSSAARAARSRSRSSRKNISFPKAPVAPHPPPALGVPGLQPSASAWDKYVSEFRHYMLEWAAFNKRYVDHFQARCHEIEMQRRDGDFSWLTSADGDNNGINRYLDWMEQDEEVRARWSVACSGHDLEVRKFMAYRERMRQV